MIIQTNKTNRIEVTNKNEYIMKMQKCITEMDCKQLNIDPNTMVSRINQKWCMSHRNEK